MLCKQYLLLYH